MSHPYQNPYNYQYGQQQANKGYYPPNTNVDIYGQPIMNPNQLTQEKLLLLKEVEQNFNVKTLTNQMINNVKGDIVNITLVIKKDLSLPLEIACDDMFPYTCPRIIIKRKIKHEKVDQKTMEFEFYKDYQWNYQKSKAGCNLMNLITFIQSVFLKTPPQSDVIFEQCQKYEVKIINDIKILETMNCYSLFPNKNNEELRTMVNYSPAILDNLIVQHDNYKKAAESLIEFIEFNQKISGQMSDKKKNLEDKRAELESMAQLFDIKKDTLVAKFNQTNMIKERFNKTKILSVLEQEIGKLDDEGSENIEFNFKKSVQINQFDEQLSQYFENRKRYHRHVIKKQKIEQNI